MKPFEEGWYCEKHEKPVDIEMWYLKECQICDKKKRVT